MHHHCKYLRAFSEEKHQMINKVISKKMAILKNALQVVVSVMVLANISAKFFMYSLERNLRIWRIKAGIDAWWGVLFEMRSIICTNTWLSDGAEATQMQYIQML